MGFVVALSLATILSTGSLPATVVGPSGIELERVADESYDPPGLPGEAFLIEQVSPVVCDGRVVFAGITEEVVNTALYSASSSGIEVVANVATPIPGTPGTFQRARAAACGGDRVYFLGSNGSIVPTSVYAWRDGAIEPMLAAGSALGPYLVQGYVEVGGDTAGLAPGFAATGAVFQQNSESTDALVFKDFSSPQAQLLAQGFSTLLPGRTVPPDTLSEPRMRGSDVVVRASFPPLGASGLYRWSPGLGFSEIVNNTTFYPEVGSSFAGFEFLTSLDAGLAFSSLFSGGLGIFAVRDDGSIVPLVVPGDVTADGDTLVYARFPSGAKSLMSFTGRTAENPDQDAIFVRTPDGSIRRIIGNGDFLEGRLINRVLSGADDRDVAIWTQSSTGGISAVIYRASFTGPVVEVPVSSPAALIGFGCLLGTVALVFVRRWTA